MIDADKDSESALLQKVKNARATGEAVSATLKTDERVFARITDGIYREPASALRELIANSYDADATVVRVDTDAPRFSRITVRDDGHGLSEAALVHAICHIGGSLKRTSKGSQYDVVSSSNSSLSPQGRKLIGKLGIGLFSVSQLTHHLTIVTKVKGEPVRRVCDILLMPQSDAADSKPSGVDEKFVTGKVQITSIPASDLDSHGTEITLLDIRPYVRESLQSSSLWASIAAEPDLSPEDSISSVGGRSSDVDEIDAVHAEEDDDFVERPAMPSFHIGRVSRFDSEILVIPPRLPWDIDDSPTERFKKFVAGVQSLDTGIISKEKIKLSDVVDTYFRTIWTLSLSVPIPYIEKHPFSLNSFNEIDYFALNNKQIRPRAEQLNLQAHQSLRDRCQLSTPDEDSKTPFSVIFDGVELRRPITFRSLSNDAETTKPMLFVGRIKSDMATLPVEYNGGPIEIEAYFYWQPRIVPAEHNGIIVRINGASGIMFDDSFFKYQVSEQTRLRQITAEIFVVRGLDAALNIDRESFNVAHPHYQFLRKWVHHSLRQLVSKHKGLTKGSRDKTLKGVLVEAVDRMAEIVVQGSPGVPERLKVQFASSAPLIDAAENTISLNSSVVMGARAKNRTNTVAEKLRESLVQEQIKAVAAVLQDYQAFSTLTPELRDELLGKIVAIFSVELK